MNSTSGSNWPEDAFTLLCSIDPKRFTEQGATVKYRGNYLYKGEKFPVLKQIVRGKIDGFSFKVDTQDYAEHDKLLKDFHDVANRLGLPYVNNALDLIKGAGVSMSFKADGSQCALVVNNQRTPSLSSSDLDPR